MKKTIKKIVVLSAVLTLFASPAVFAGNNIQNQNNNQNQNQIQNQNQNQTSTQTQSGVGE